MVEDSEIHCRERNERWADALAGDGTKPPAERQGIIPTLQAVADAEQREVRDKWHAMCLSFEEQFAQNAQLHDLYDGAQRMIPGFQAEVARLRAELETANKALAATFTQLGSAEATIERIHRYAEGRMEGWAIDIRERLNGEQG